MPDPARIFISYRRSDAIVHATLLHDRLAERFGAANVFLDKEDIPLGTDFERTIEERLAGYDVLVAVIGPRWAELLAARRPDAPDYVRREIARAFARGMRVIPVFVGGATAAQFAAVPDELAPLRTVNGLEIRDAELRFYITALAEAIQGRRFDEIVDDLRRAERRRRIGRFAALGVGLTVFFAAWVSALDWLALDARFAAATLWLGALGARTASADDIVLVTIDAATVQHVGRPFDRSWRREHAVVVERLAAAGARTIAIDLFFREPDAAHDAMLAAAIERARTGGAAVVIGVDAFEGAQPKLVPTLASAASGWGIACAGEKLGVARSMPLAAARGETALPSLALAAFGGGAPVEAVDARANVVRIRPGAGGRLAAVGFSMLERAGQTPPACPAIRRGDLVALQLLEPVPAGFWLDPVRRIRYEKLLAGTDAAERVKERYVLIGLTLEGEDVLRTGAGPRPAERFGVELHAAQLDSILRGDVIRPLGASGQLGVMLALGFAGAAARHRADRLRPFTRWLALAVALTLYLGIVFFALRFERILMNVPYEIGAFALAYWLTGRIGASGVAR